MIRSSRLPVRSFLPRFATGAMATVSLCALAVPAAAQPVDEVNRVVDEGMNHSEVMQNAHELTDEIGGRLTNSPAMRRAEQWAIDKFASWGLQNVRRDGFEFGRGWEMLSWNVTMVTPRALELTAVPIAWTPPTDGTVQAQIVVAPMSKEEHFEKWRGKLAGKIVLVSLPGTGDEPDEAPFQRLSAEDIGKRDAYRQPEHDPDALDRRVERVEFAEKLDAFLAAEGAVAMVRMSYRDGKLVHGSGYTYRVGHSPVLPAVELAAEDYRRLTRLARSAEDGGTPPTLSITSNVRFVDTDTRAYNVIAEIPGSDPRGGYVMAGAHLDSWAAGDGAADNGAGSVAIMEAARILSELGIRPKRTIRFALWAGEEQGLLGSLAYVEKYIASRPPQSAKYDGFPDSFGWANRYPITKRAGYGDLKAYFNIDNGSGKLRGIHAEGNAAAEPLLRQWLSPFADMGAGTVVGGPTGGTDHVYMQAVGVPAFQFIQDPLDYFSRLHHTNADTFDHLKADDLRQASTVLAGVLLQAANSDKVLPRFPLQTEPTPTNPFEYKDPDEE